MVRTTFLLKECMILMILMIALPTNQQTDQRIQPIHLKNGTMAMPEISDILQYAHSLDYDFCLVEEQQGNVSLIISLN